MKTISYALLACNEEVELKILLTKIKQFIDKDDEIIIVFDKGNTTQEVIDVVNKFELNIKTYERSLNKDFASQKNYLFSKCKCDYIFNLDPDEIPNDELFKILKTLLEKNPEVDIFWLPRVNIVNNLDKNYVKQLNWNINEQGWINWPDPQQRIIKNHKNIEWKGKVHERLTNYKSHSFLPYKEEYSLLHVKEFKKQLFQNKFYDEIVKNK